MDFSSEDISFNLDTLSIKSCHEQHLEQSLERVGDDAIQEITYHEHRPRQANGIDCGQHNDGCETIIGEM